MNLHQNTELFRDAIKATAQFLGTREIFIEKDYWVTLALYEVFHSNMADQVVFKGGTALSKCYKLIERFSEDIDLVIFRNEAENDNQSKKKLRAISRLVEQIMPEIEVFGLTNKKGNIRKTVHQYGKLYGGEFGQIREHIVLEVTWLGSVEPYIYQVISSYVGDMLKGQKQLELIETYNLAPFEVRVLSKARTFCEKIMSLVRFSRTDTPISDLRNKIRHVYDIYCLLQDEEVSSFFEQADFGEMLIKVGNDNVVGFKNNNDWLFEHPASAIIFSEEDEVWRQLSPVYNTRFRELVTGELPGEEQIILTLKRVGKRLKQIDWNLIHPQ